MSAQLSFRRTFATLLLGNSTFKFIIISFIKLGYLVSQVIRSLTARPFGLDKLPSPNAIPIINAFLSLIFTVYRLAQYFSAAGGT